MMVFSLRRILKNIVDYFIYRIISKKLDELLVANSIEKLIKLLKDLIFDKDQKESVPSDLLHENAVNSLSELIKKDVFNKFKNGKFWNKISNNHLNNKKIRFISFLIILIKIVPFVSQEELGKIADIGSKNFVESFQYPLLNKHVFL